MALADIAIDAGKSITLLRIATIKAMAYTTATRLKKRTTVSIVKPFTYTSRCVSVNNVKENLNHTQK